MEVHAHAHTPRKKWTHYFWEFLMLFLAVFCGFMAENQREHLIENRKEKDYMLSLTHDLGEDTVLINRCIKQLDFVIAGHDSLELLLLSVKNETDFLQKLYYTNTAFTLTDFYVDWIQGTFEELKGSGNLRLISSKVIKQKLREYETAKKWSDDQHLFVAEAISKTYYFATDIFDVNSYGKYNVFINEKWPDQLFIPFDSAKKFLSDDPKLLAYDPILIKKYQRLVNNEKVLMIVYRSYIKSAKEKCLALINVIRSEYHFQ